jgi:hypothetical protein
MAGREKAIILLKTAYGYHATDKLLLENLSVRGRLHFRNFIISKRLSRSRQLVVHLIPVYDFGPASISHYIG